MRAATTAYEIFRFLRRVGAARASDIHRGTGLPYTKIYAGLRTLMKRGYVVKIGPVYVLVKNVWGDR